MEMLKFEERMKEECKSIDVILQTEQIEQFYNYIERMKNNINKEEK